jgi:hypothetical protein
LTTEGKCGVRSENFYLAVDDGCTFSVTEGGNRKELRVDHGVIYFAVNQMTDKLSFFTPAGDISTQQVRLNADFNRDIVKGYIDVREKMVQFGVLEGGSLVVATASGVQEIRSGNQITLAMDDPLKKDDNQQEAVSTEGEGATSKKTVTSGNADKALAVGNAVGSKVPAAYFVGGSVLAGAAVAGIVANQLEEDDTSPSPASPASP